MNGKELTELCSEPEFDIDLSPATKSQWSNLSSVSKAIFRNTLRKHRSHIFNNAIVPIVEFHKFDLFHGHKADSFAKRVNNKQIIEKLRNDNPKGIYAFYGSDGNLIYVGKTEKNSLFNEMAQRYNSKAIKFKIINKGKARWEKLPIRDIAQYVSAYKISNELIADVEALLTRITINNTANLKVEHFKGSKVDR